MRFQLNEFAGRTEQEMAELAQKHFVDFVKEKIYMDAFELVQRLKVLEKPVILLSATNVVIARPVAEYFGFDDCLATELELADGKYTGCISGVYTMGKGKIEVAREYCEARNVTLDDAAYYGDSINDVYILDAVGFPVAVNPGEELRNTAEKHNWEILNFE
jgi:HAD superfamily hydrolase (TIGR01490 family)